MNNERPYVLLVEDNPADARLVQEALAEALLDCELAVLRDGRQGIDYIEGIDSDPSRRCPDLFLLDLNLPNVSGNEVLSRLRKSPKCSAVKVLIVSSSDAPTDRARAMELGASGYFRKPSSLDQFMEIGPRIKELLESSAT